MSDENKKKKKKSWIVKALVCFLIIMGILTFFSNTIMNMTLTQVSTQQIYGATLSTITRAPGTVKANTEVEVKAPGAVTVGQLQSFMYQSVEAGEVLTLLDLPENTDALDEKKKQLEDLEKQMEYDARTPSDGTDFYTLETGVEDAQKTLDEAKKTLDEAKNKDTLINQTKNDIDSLAAQIEKATEEKSDLEKKKQDAEETRDNWNAMLPDLRAAKDAAQKAFDECIKDPADPAYDPDYLAYCEEALKAANDAVTEAENGYNTASNNVNNYKNQISDKNKTINNLEESKTEKETLLAEYKLLPKVSDAERKVRDAEHALDTAQKSLNDARTKAGIDYDKDQDALNESYEKKEKLEKEVKELEDLYAMTEIVAPISGTIIEINVSKGQKMEEKQVMFKIADMDSGFYIECSVDKKNTEGLMIGSPVKTDICEEAYVESIRPDPMNPSGANVVRISVSGHYLVPGNTVVNCTISTSNKSYENVVPKGSVHTDGEESFIYVLVTKNSPLGERYIARKVTVKILAEDSTSCAIEGAGINYAYCIVRTEKPISNGEQVRLAKGESN